jgi:predicted ATPase
MRVTHLALENFRSFARLGSIKLDRINVIVGPNNAGKSSLLRALQLLQEGVVGNLTGDIRRGASAAIVTIGLADVPSIPGWGRADASAFRVTISTQGSISRVLANEQPRLAR